MGITKDPRSPYWRYETSAVILRTPTTVQTDWMGTFVYVIGGDSGPVKNGFSACPEIRLAGIQTGNPQKLRVLAKVPGGEKEEQDLHQLFQKDRVEGEWFKRTAVVRVFIEMAASGVGVSLILKQCRARTKLNPAQPSATLLPLTREPQPQPTSAYSPIAGQIRNSLIANRRGPQMKQRARKLVEAGLDYSRVVAFLQQDFPGADCEAAVKEAIEHFIGLERSRGQRP